MSDQDMTSDFSEFQRLTNEHFQFLFDEFSFKESDATMVMPAMWLDYRSATSQVRVYFEYGDGMNTTIATMVERDGRLVPGRQYALRDFLALRAPDWKWKPNPHDFDAPRMSEWLEDNAAAVRCHVADVLLGDFRVLEEVERAQAERLQRRSSRTTG